MPRVGYVALIGRPNAGKSTLLNALIGEKVSAVSARPQTTQRAIHGILTDETKGFQIIFLDTPGIHEIPKKQKGDQLLASQNINERINAQAFASLRKADMILRLVDPSRPQKAEDARIDEVLGYIDTPVFRVETKQDLPRSYPGENIDFAVDSLHKVGFEVLLDAIQKRLPEGPYLYESDYYTDQAMDLRISEIIREELFGHLQEELPYACYIQLETIENTPKLLRIIGQILVESESQKKILIGKGGEKIQEISMQSRLALEGIFEKKIFLALRVKVHKNWRKQEAILAKLFPKK